MEKTSPEKPRAVLLGVQLPGVSDAELGSSLDELARLAKTLGFEVVGRVTQKRGRMAPGAVVGSGKLRELARWTGGTGVIPVGPPGKKSRAHGAEEPDTDVPGGDRGRADEAYAADEAEAFDEAAEADGGASGAERGEPAAGPPGPEAPPRATLVLVDHEITPSQARNLERATGAEVLDRTAVILAIFQRHARSREARLQVEIARLEYVAPRLRETGGGRDREGGGIGGRGAGESASELDRRKVRDRIAELRAELAGIERTDAVRRRRRGDVHTVALVGYTNAGKSSWMRALTASEVLVQDKLFATLGTTVRVLQPEGPTRVLVSDTVGFIKHLPHDLVASFRSTLDEARYADLLVHVVDASDPACEAQIAVTCEVLDSIGALEGPRLVVLNKADRLDELSRARVRAAHPDALLLSVKDPSDVSELRERLVAHFEGELEEAELLVPYARQRVVARAHESGQVLRETCDAEGTHLLVRASASVLARLRAELG
jgi:GTP-binding protein HflX